MGVTLLSENVITAVTFLVAEIAEFNLFNNIHDFESPLGSKHWFLSHGSLELAP